MKETDIVKHIHYRIIEEYNNKGYVWNVDEIICFILATILPYDKIIMDSLYIGKLSTICDAFKEFFKGRGKSKLKQEIRNLTFDSAKKYFNDKLIPILSLNYKTRIIEELKISSSISNDGYIVVRYNENGCANILKLYKDYENLSGATYGTNEYGIEYVNEDLQEENTINSSSATEDDELDRNNKKSFNVECDADLTNEKLQEENTVIGPSTTEEDKSQENDAADENASLTSIYKELNSIWKNIEYDSALMPYVWKMRISYENYDKLKNCLKKCIEHLPSGYGVLPNFISAHAVKMLVYIAEWYKWEFNGNNNSLADIGIEGQTNIVKKIWDELNYNEFVYKAATNTLWLDSLYVLGGIPLKLANDSDKLNKLFNIISTDDEDIIDEDIENIFKTNSKAIKNSLTQKNGSLRKYIERLLDLSENEYEKLFSESDFDREIVRNFIGNLTTGKRANINLKNCLKEEWMFYTFDGDEECLLSFKLKIGFNKDECNLRVGCLESDVTRFNLCISNSEDANSECPFIRFSKKVDWYIGWSSSNNLRINSASDRVDVKVYKNTCGENPEIINTYSLGEKYIEIYSLGDSYGWSTKKNNKADKAVLFPLDKYCIKGKVDFEEKTINKKSWGFCRILDNITLVDDNGQEIILYKQFGIDVMLSRWKDGVVQYKNDIQPLVKYIDDANSDYELPLVIGWPIDGKVIIYNSLAKKDKQRRELDLKDSKLSTFPPQNGKKNQPELGTFTFKVIHSDSDSKKDIKCFFLPPDFINRNLEKNIIEFKDHYAIESISIGDKLLEKTDSKYVYYDNVKCIDSEYLTFNIKTKKGDKIELDICRPLERRELFFNNQLLQDADFAVPHILKDKYSLRIFDENGVRHIDFKNRHWINYNFSHINPSEDDGKIEFKQVTIYKYKEDVQNLKDNQEYKFYSWNVSTNDVPCKIDNYEKCTDKMVFQSLKESRPCHYIYPKYKEKHWKQLLENINYNNDLYIKCFEIALEHKIPFSQFYPLQRLIKDHKIDYDLKPFLEVFAESERQNVMTENYYHELHRFAHEFGFEWFLMPKVLWRCGIYKPFLKKLLKNSPFITKNTRYFFDRIIDILVDRIVDLSRRQGDICRYIRGDQDQMILDDKFERRVNIIEEIYNNEQIIIDLYKKFRELKQQGRIR